LSRTEEIINGVLAGKKRSIAKAITAVENCTDESPELIAKLFPHTGKAHIIGITGAGGSGKSTLIEKIVREYRGRGKTVGVVAVDPTSPFSGGAFLGDRIRMQELSVDEGVFIRSMATRNYPGGIARATKDAAKVLDAAGKDVIIIETVGAGQSEVEIIRVAQTVVVVHAPGLGDEIQAIKAGIMEIADIFVVNKADRENADKAVIDIESNMQLSSKQAAWKPPVLKTTALTGEGVRELVDKIEEHRCYLEGDNECRIALLKKRTEAELVEAIREKAADILIDELRRKGTLDGLLQNILEKKVDPASAAEKILKENLRNDGA
jgi:LAO/AO transport system kinase